MAEISPLRRRMICPLESIGEIFRNHGARPRWGDGFALKSLTNMILL
jgi:hypothetical protein